MPRSRSSPHPAQQRPEPTGGTGRTLVSDAVEAGGRALAVVGRRHPIGASQTVRDPHFIQRSQQRRADIISAKIESDGAIRYAIPATTVRLVIALPVLEVGDGGVRTGRGIKCKDEMRPLILSQGRKFAVSDSAAGEGQRTGLQIVYQKPEGAGPIPVAHPITIARVPQFDPAFDRDLPSGRDGIPVGCVGVNRALEIVVIR